MTKIEKLLQIAWDNYNSFKNIDNSASFDDEFGKVMKEYAELYCEEFRRNLLNSGYHYENLHIVDFTTVETLPLHPHE